MSVGPVYPAGTFTCPLCGTDFVRVRCEDRMAWMHRARDEPGWRIDFTFETWSENRVMHEMHIYCRDCRDAAAVLWSLDVTV